MIYSFAGTFNYAYTDAHPGIVRGYVFTACHRAHAHCGCIRGKPCVLLVEHNSAAGDFPMHFLDAYYHIYEYLQHHNLDILSDDELDAIWSAYGWIYEWQLLPSNPAHGAHGEQGTPREQKLEPRERLHAACNSAGSVEESDTGKPSDVD